MKTFLYSLLSLLPFNMSTGTLNAEPLGDSSTNAVSAAELETMNFGKSLVWDKGQSQISVEKMYENFLNRTDYDSKADADLEFKAIINKLIKSGNLHVSGGVGTGAPSFVS